MRVESGIDFLQAHETLNEQPRANQQHQRQRHLGDDEETSCTTTAGSGRRSYTGLLERFVEVDSGALKRRRHTEYHAGRQRKHKGKAYYSRINRSILQAWYVRTQPDEKLDAPYSQEKAGGASEEGKQHALCE